LHGSAKQGFFLRGKNICATEELKCSVDTRLRKPLSARRERIRARVSPTYVARAKFNIPAFAHYEPFVSTGV
jgi:hypothetical protein